MYSAVSDESKSAGSGSKNGFKIDGFMLVGHAFSEVEVVGWSGVGFRVLIRLAGPT